MLRGFMDRNARARGLAALGDPLRLGIVELLEAQDLSPQSLAASLEVPSNLLAHHLRVLEEAGLVVRQQSEGDRRRTYVHLDSDLLTALLLPVARISVRRVVFVCTGNSARSILAECIWSRHSEVPASSAGTHPAQRIHPRTRAAARRAGLDLQRQTPQHVGAVLRPDDLVISVCDSVNEEGCGPAAARLHWSIPDPALVNTDRAFDAAVAELTRRIEHLAPSVLPRTGSRPRRIR